MRNRVIKHFKLRRNVSNNDILKCIHFNRDKKIPGFIEEYLTNHFLKFKDIRYFNEYLWIATKKDLIYKNKIVFKKNFKQNIFKFNYNKKLKYCLNLKKTDVKLDFNRIKNNSICLIGNPIFFIFIYLYLRFKNIKVDVINVKYHNNKIIFFIFYNFIFDLIYKIVFFKNYKIINIKLKKDIKNIKLNKIYDIGFHKLNFIIPKNILKSFKKGLINDHWAPLPLFKGRSSLDYAKLFGSKLIITNHLVTNKIDEGKILLYSEVNNYFPFLSIYFNISKRILFSINQLSLNRFIKRKINGIYFFKMHPWLKKLII